LAFLRTARIERSSCGPSTSARPDADRRSLAQVRGPLVRRPRPVTLVEAEDVDEAFGAAACGFGLQSFDGLVRAGKRRQPESGAPGVDPRAAAQPVISSRRN